ncbi:MAG: hypothetical protein NUV61_02890 [Candidatus Azambacteria bacterium]|nr:hypothetical protein [Candidatus Azambacteria bacterium]
MPPTKDNGLPFITRKMLAFEEGTVFKIQLRIYSVEANQIEIKGMTKEGLFTFRLTTNGTGIIEQHDFSIPDIPIMLMLVDSSGNFSQGQCYASIVLLANGSQLFQLATGLVYREKSLSYPAVNQENTIPNRGDFTRRYSANPAAGAEVVFTVPSGRVWNPKMLYLKLVTSATVANRRVHVVISSQGQNEFHTFCDIDQTASTTREYSVANMVGVPDREDGGWILIPLPANLWLTADESIETLTTNIQAGDNFDVATLHCEEFISRVN